MTTPAKAGRGVLQQSLCWLVAAVALAACSGRESQNRGAGNDTGPERSGRFGSLRDLVLFERWDVDPGAWLLVDRFEVTQADWAGFAATPAGRRVAADDVRLVGNPALPVAGMDLYQARAFAAWRFARLPEVWEWEFVTVGDGHSRFPWGNKADATRTNTGDLALGEVTPVGTFESGRKPGIEAPYDLIGNVREWTESVPWSWCRRDLDWPTSFTRCWSRALRTPAISVWSGMARMVPAGVIAGVGGDGVPRVVVGADFQTPMTELYGEQAPRERRARTGLRLYTTVAELLHRLARDASMAPDEVERTQLRLFFDRADQRQTMAAVWRQLAPDEAELPADSLVIWLSRELSAAVEGVPR